MFPVPIVLGHRLLLREGGGKRGEAFRRLCQLA